MRKLFFCLLILIACVHISFAQGKIERPSANKIVQTKGIINGHAYVDLGLPSGTKWATCNVGAHNETEYGNFYSWGEMNIKRLYSQDNGATMGLNLDDISGDSHYDVAKKLWGSTWRIPTIKEIKELIENCSYRKEKRNGRNGYVFIGRNGNQIFLPASNCAPMYEYQLQKHEEPTKCYYWSSSPSDRTYNNLAYYLFDDGTKLGILDCYKSTGMPIRPVSK